MMRKENRNPNRQPTTLNKSITGKQHHHPSITPDANTSRMTYKPKFIKKFINVQREDSQCSDLRQESIEQTG